jgi:hypothetical protein
MSALETARTAHDPCPDWIEALARECDRTSQNKTAALLGYTAGAISAVLRAKYGASTDAIEQTVRGALVSETVTCPALGEIGKQCCLKWRRKARVFSNANSLSVTMYRACTRCPLHQEGKDG